jgi:DNA-binding CsgD family transcriptional regulator
VNALLRAAELSPQPADRSRRLAEAAYVGADITGELRSATRLLGDARRSDPGTGGSLRMAVAAAYVLLNGDGDVDTAHRLLVGAIETGRGDAAAGDTALVEAVQTLLFVCLWGDRAELWNSFHAVMTSLQPDVEPLLDLQVRLMADPVRTARGALADLDAEIAGLSEERDLGRIERIARAGVYVDRIPACREALWRVVADGRRGGAVAAGLNALHLLSVDDFKGGRWDESRRLTDEGLRLCEAHGYALMSLPFRLTQALIAAGRGEYATTQALTEEMFRWATPRGLGGVRMFVSHALTLAALGRGDFDDAYRHASAISPAGTFPPHVAHALVVPLYLVEAAVRTGRHQEAADHVRAMLDAGLPALSPRLALLTAGARAIATPGPGALEAFEEALAVPGAERAPFDLARIQLAYGERLRRARSTTGSRIQLAAAQAAFQRLGARPWADRAGSELRAAGLWTDGSDGGATGVLTPQEQEVAQLAASGLTNRQIAERLLLSHRTVGAHLRQVFPKLGVSSRAGLRDALAAHSRSDGARPTGQAS